MLSDSLVNNRYRKNTNPDNIAATGYPEDPGNDKRFISSIGSINRKANVEWEELE